MNKTLILIFFLVNYAFAQKRDVVYRISYDSYPTIGYFYGVSILYLRDDYSYKLLEQEYNSRKMARKNVLRSSKTEYGNWKMSGDTLLLNDNYNRQSMKFIKVNDKKIAFIIDDVERSRYCWKRMKN